MRPHEYGHGGLRQIAQLPLRIATGEMADQHTELATVIPQYQRHMADNRLLGTHRDQRREADGPDIGADLRKIGLLERGWGVQHRVYLQRGSIDLSTFELPGFERRATLPLVALKFGVEVLFNRPPQ